MSQKTTILKSLRQWRYNHRLLAAIDRFERAAKQRAELKGELAQAFDQVTFYYAWANSIDPQKDWNEFARLKQKHFEAMQHHDIVDAQHIKICNLVCQLEIRIAHIRKEETSPCPRTPRRRRWWFAALTAVKPAT